MGLSALSVALWAVALVASVWVLVPTIAFLLRVGGIRTDVLVDVGPPVISGDQAVFDERLSQLAALGFRDAGRTRQTALFMLPGHWRWQQFETTRWFAGPDSRTHATLYRMIRDEPARISFVTVFDDGGVVLTTCPGTGHAPSLPNFRVTEFRGLEASQLLAAHDLQVAAFVRDRGVNARAATVAEITAASNAAESTLVRQMGHGLHGMLLSFAPAALFVVGGFMKGFLWSPVVPLGVCVAAAAYAFRLWMVIGPMRHLVTRRSHVGDAMTETAPAGPAPAGPAEVAPDGTTEGMRKARRALRAVALVSGALMFSWPLVLGTRPQKVAAVGVSVIAMQLFMICMTAVMGLAVLRRERGGTVARAPERDSGHTWLFGMIPLCVITLLEGRRTPGMYGVAGLVLVALLVIRFIPKKK